MGSSERCPHGQSPASVTTIVTSSTTPTVSRPGSVEPSLRVGPPSVDDVVVPGRVLAGVRGADVVVADSEVIEVLGTGAAAGAGGELTVVLRVAETGGKLPVVGRVEPSPAQLARRARAENTAKVLTS